MVNQSLYCLIYLINRDSDQRHPHCTHKQQEGRGHMWVTWVTWLRWVQHLSIRLGFRLLARLGLACWCGPIHEVLKVGIGHILQHGGWDCDHLGRMFEDHPQGVAGRLRGATSCIDGSRHQAMPRITNSTHAIPGWLTIWGIDGPKRTMHIAWWQGKGHLDIFVVPLIPKVFVVLWDLFRFLDSLSADGMWELNNHACVGCCGVHDHVQLTKSQISGSASVVVVPSISAINLTLSPPLIVVQASTSVVSKQNACQVPEFQALWKCIGKVSGKFGPLHDIWVWSTNSGGGCLVHGRDWHIEEFHWHHHQSKDSTFLPSFDGWKSVIQLQASFSVGWSHHKSFPVTRWSLHSDLVHIQHTSTDQFHERLFRLVHWERIRLSRSQLNVLPRPSSDDPFRWHSHRTAWRIWQLHDDVVFRMPLWNTCRIASGKLGLGTHIFAPLMEVSFSLKGDVHLATDADILRAGIQLWNSCNWNHQCDQPPHHVSRGWLGRKGGNRGWSSLHFWSQTSNAYLWRKRKRIENNIWPVHARAQNLHFGVQHCRSHANKLLLKFLNKHVMICDDIVALKPWFYDDILQSDTNIHHSRTASLPAQARFLDPVGRLKQHSKRPTSRDGDFASLQDGAEVRSTTALAVSRCF